MEKEISIKHNVVKQPRLFTPGPLNTSLQVKAAMSVDLGSRTSALTEVTQNIRDDLEEIAVCGTAYTSILLQGSGTFAVEAMLSSLIQTNDCVLIVSNGVYGDRLSKICKTYAMSYFILQQDITAPINIDDVQAYLNKEPRISHIAVVQFETAVGILNDIDALLNVAQCYNCQVLIDAMSSFGAINIPYNNRALIAVASSANKCLHSVPGVSFVIVRLEKLLKINTIRTLSLDLKAQWQEFNDFHQWRFTPPTHVLLAFRQALIEFKSLGGVSTRFNKYNDLNSQLVNGLAEIGILPAIPVKYRAPMITTFLLKPDHIDFNTLYLKLMNQDLVIYPSSFIPEKSFRVGCMGELDMNDIKRLIIAIKNLL